MNFRGPTALRGRAGAAGGCEVHPYPSDGLNPVTEKSRAFDGGDPRRARGLFQRSVGPEVREGANTGEWR
jgi:hypothetical protein